MLRYALMPCLRYAGDAIAAADAAASYALLLTPRDADATITMRHAFDAAMRHAGAIRCYRSAAILPCHDIAASCSSAYTAASHVAAAIFFTTDIF